MTKKPLPLVDVRLDRIIGGGQAIGTLESGKKCLVWGGLPGETVRVQLTKKKSSFVEGIVTEVITPSPERIAPHDPDSYLSTSPWQIMDFAAESHYKSALIEEAFELHDIVLPAPITVWSDGSEYEYRNKIEYSFWYDETTDKLGFAFFRRGSHGKIQVSGTSLAAPAIESCAQTVLNALNTIHADGRHLKTLLVRSNRAGVAAWQLYVKDKTFDTTVFIVTLGEQAKNGEIIYSNPKSPASVITERLYSGPDIVLEDTILDIPFRYATEGFFQINLPVYEQALRDMKEWISTTPEPLTTKSEETSAAQVRQGAGALVRTWSEAVSSDFGSEEANGNHPIIDLYSGVGTIGLTIGGDDVTLIEINEHAVREMEQNIQKLGKTGAKAVLAASENALDHISSNAIIIVDPPRAGLHEKVIEKILETGPSRIIYLSCNPVTQARDVARLADKYGIRYHQGYNFFPRTPHIEHLVILDKLEPCLPS